jgi:hypothetical protein
MKSLITNRLTFILTSAFLLTFLESGCADIAQQEMSLSKSNVTHASLSDIKVNNISNSAALTVDLSAQSPIFETTFGKSYVVLIDLDSVTEGSKFLLKTYIHGITDVVFTDPKYQTTLCPAITWLDNSYNPIITIEPDFSYVEGVFGVGRHWKGESAIPANARYALVHRSKAPAASLWVNDSQALYTGTTTIYIPKGRFNTSIPCGPTGKLEITRTRN